MLSWSGMLVVDCDSRELRCLHGRWSFSRRVGGARAEVQLCFMEFAAEIEPITFFDKGRTFENCSDSWYEYLQL